MDSNYHSDSNRNCRCCVETRWSITSIKLADKASSYPSLIPLFFVTKGKGEKSNGNKRINSVGWNTPINAYRCRDVFDLSP